MAIVPIYLSEIGRREECDGIEWHSVHERD